jgi:hypothetical protein
MGERVFEPTATKMATISSGKAASAMPREQHPTASRPPKLPRARRADTGREWSRKNTPSNGRDIAISASPSPHNDASAATAGKWPLENTGSHPMGGTGRGTIVQSIPVQWKEQLEGPREGNPPMLSKMRRWECNDPPPLTQEDEGTPPPHDFASPSPVKSSRLEIEQWFTPTTGLDASVVKEDSLCSFYTAKTPSQSTPSSSHGYVMEKGYKKETSTYNPPRKLLEIVRCNSEDGWEERNSRHGYNLRDVGLDAMEEDHLNEMLYQRRSERNTRTGARTATGDTTLSDRQEVSRAMQQLVLLRRCFFPRRDVIRWYLISEGCAVQKAQPFGI